MKKDLDEESNFDSNSEKSKKKSEFGAYDDDIGGLAKTPSVEQHSNPEKIQKLLTPVKPEIKEEDKIIVHPLHREIE